MKYKISIVLLLWWIQIYTSDQQLLMFIHTQSCSLQDEEGLNVAYQALTAITQKAAPLLMSENIWQHVVLRKDRFSKKIHDNKSIEFELLAMHQAVNLLLQNNNKDVAVVNQICNQIWYQNNYSRLSQLNQDSYKHLLFDYFCYDIFNQLSGWSVYQIAGGYLLWIPDNRNHGFLLQRTTLLSPIQLHQGIFLQMSVDIDMILSLILEKNNSIVWSFYATGHGYHQDDEHIQTTIAGMKVSSFFKVLKFFDKKCTTNIFVYSSCFGAGKNSIIPYQKNNKDLLLSYPVVVISLTDAPAYVFGFPAGYTLPPYTFDRYLMNADVGDKGLRHHFLQKFDMFCVYAKTKQASIELVKTLNPYVECSFNCCKIIKIENIPLIRKAYSTFFVPLDYFQVYSITQAHHKDIVIKDRVACLWYVNAYYGTISLSSCLPVFVSMIPGNQVHYIKKLVALEYRFSDVINSVFLGIDDIHDQTIYSIDTLSCDIKFSEISQHKIHEFKNVLVLPKGLWQPVFSDNTSSCYVYVQYQKNHYEICFDQSKQVSLVRKLDTKQVDVLTQFKQFLIKKNRFGHAKSIPMLLSAQHFNQQEMFQKDLLNECLQQLICKDIRN